MSHWVLKGIKHEFICENTNEWDPHPVSMTNTEIVETEYHTLADGPRGPQIATHMNTIALQFPIKSVHTETVNILHNFIHHALIRVSNEGKVGMGLIKAYDILKQKRKAKETKVPFFQNQSLKQLLPVNDKNSQKMKRINSSQ
jgi:hypothetical protein